MKRLNWILAALFISMAAPAFAVNNINIFLGQKTLDSSDWGASSYLGYGLPLDEQGEFGVLMDFAGYNWPVSIAVDLLGSAREEDFYSTTWGPGTTTASTSELDVGVRKIFDIYGTSLHPYVGGGLALITGRIEDDYYYYGITDDEDTGLGIWLNGGIYWSFAEHFNLGVDLRVSDADVTLYGETVNAGGTHGGLMFGYRW